MGTKKNIVSLLLILLTLLFLTSCNNSASGNCNDPQIKGNLTTYNGEKIYHVPGGQFYEVTDAEEMFCSEEEAEEAGYRRSLR
ncbi:sunset domain-containing protein [Neobacillus dielmonensis]|uniref:sunset domain-containing protein n=1 Tax=Neobacillus dielmonensis TaxID=1347369 RepID=UPI0005A5E630|nr:hypothetical protein [Neobacillus dielmonensis]